MIFKILYGLMVLAHLLGSIVNRDEYMETITYKLQYAIILIGCVAIVAGLE